MSGEVEAYFDPDVKKKQHNLFTPLADSEDIYQAVMISGLWEQISVTSAWAAFKEAAVLALPLDGTHVLL